MTSPAASTANGVRDFTVSVEPIVFRCDGREYKAPRTINPINLRAIMESVGGVNWDDQAYLMTHFEDVTPVLATVLKALVPGPGGQHLAQRLQAPLLSEEEYEADPEAVRPLDMLSQAMPIMAWLLEELGLRPTTPPLPYSVGSAADTTAIPSDGTSSMAGSSPGGSTSES